MPITTVNQSRPSRLFRALRALPFRASRASSAFAGRGPLEPLAARTAGGSAGILALLALAGAQVRVLPWLLDPRVPWRVAMPFSRAVASVAIEAAVLVGWPIGWALAAFVLAERGEARVLATLGERPARTTMRLLPMALVFGAVLAGASLAGGRDASEPGRVIADLLRAGRTSCAKGGKPSAIEVPLVGAVWLCDGSNDPHLVGRPPLSHASRGGSSLYSARTIDVSSDARRIDLDDAFISVAGAERDPPAGVAPIASLHVKHALFRLPPFVRASSLPAPWRAAFLASAGAVSALLAVWLLLAMEQRALTLWRFHALLLGAAGPVSALALLHLLERAEAPMPLRLYGALPLVAAVATLAVAVVVWSLPGVRVTASR
jgi:hypothetical protein